MNKCSHTIPSGQTFSSVFGSVITAVRTSTTNTVELPITRYKLGINMALRCENEAFPSWSYANAANTLGNPNPSGSGPFFGTHPWWSGYIWWDLNQDNFLQDDNVTIIGGRMHTRFASSTWCTSMGFPSSGCGVRNVNQMNLVKKETESFDGLAKHFLHESIHFWNLQDCEVTANSVTANGGVFPCPSSRSNYLDGLAWSGGYPAKDRARIAEIYAPAWVAGNQRNCASIGFAGLRYKDASNVYQYFYKIGGGFEYMANHNFDNKATEILPDWRCKVTTCDIGPSTGCFSAYPPTNAGWLPLSNWNQQNRISYIIVF